MSHKDQQRIIEIHQIITELVKAVVTKPASVVISQRTHGPLLAHEIHTDRLDVRRVIGSGGKHIKALETIAASLSQLIGMESLVTVDDPGPPSKDAPRPRDNPVGKFDPSRFENVVNLLRRLIAPFAGPKTVVLREDSGSNTVILRIQVPEQFHDVIYGRDIQFTYGPDGHVIGSIKNLFDGIGKNHGRVVRVVLDRT